MSGHRIAVPVQSLACFLAIAGASCQRAFGPETKEDVLREVGAILQREAYANGVDFGRWAAVAAGQRAAIDSAATPESFALAVNAALAEFAVSHLELMAPEAARQRYTGTRVGLGARTRPADDGRLVLSVTEGGPAWKAGLRGGDVIVQVDGVPVDPDRPLDFSEGQQPRLAWLHGGAPHDTVVPIAVGPRASPPRLRWIAGNVAVLAVPTFIDELYDRDAIDSLFADARSASALILDMRGNTGGNSDNVRHLLGRVLPPDAPLFGDVYAEQARAFMAAFPDRVPEAAAVVAWLGDERFYRPIVERGSGASYAGPLVVLIDETCGSGGELAPATLKDLDRATLVGTATQGKVRISDHLDLPGGFVLRIPVGEFVTVAGRAIEGNPVVADIRLTPAETAQDDYVFAIARAVFDGRGQHADGDTTRARLKPVSAAHVRRITASVFAGGYSRK